jgi:hypothetical protein
MAAWFVTLGSFRGFAVGTAYGVAAHVPLAEHLGLTVLADVGGPAVLDAVLFLNPVVVAGLNVDLRVVRAVGTDAVGAVVAALTFACAG